MEEIFNIFENLGSNGYELTEDVANGYLDYIDKELNLAKIKNKGWIVNFLYTNKDGDYNNGSGEYITGYVVDSNGNSKNRQLITVKIKHSTTMEGYLIVYTHGIDERPYFVLTKDNGNNMTGLV